MRRDPWASLPPLPEEQGTWRNPASPGGTSPRGKHGESGQIKRSQENRMVGVTGIEPVTPTMST